MPGLGLGRPTCALVVSAEGFGLGVKGFVA